MKIFFKKLILQVLLQIPCIQMFSKFASATGTTQPGCFLESYSSVITGVFVTLFICLIFFGCLLYSIRKKFSRSLSEQTNELKKLQKSMPEVDLKFELEQSKKKYNELLNTIMDGYVEVNLKGVITDTNKTVADIFKCQKIDLIGQHYSKLLTLTDNQYIVNEYKNILITGRAAKITNIEVTGKDNMKRVVENCVSLMIGNSGNPTGFRGIVRDVTKLTKAEDNQSILREQLQRSQQIEAIGTLAGGIAHDFNNLLMAIQGNTSILLFKMEKNHIFYNKLINIESCIQSGAELTKQLLGFAKGKRTNITVLNVNEIVKETANTFKRTKKAIQLHENYNAEAWSIEADQGQIKQVILNLLINSWQTTPERKDLYIKTENLVINNNESKCLDISEGKYLKITISNSDSLPAQKPEIQPTNELKSGITAGIGIISSSEVVKSYNGLIEFKRFNTEETAYVIYFPVSVKQKPKEIQTISIQENGTGTILFVDDEEMIIEIGKPMLEELGYDVLVARGGDEAVKVYEVNKGEIDLVILDMVMPKIDGGDVFNMLKKINPMVKTLISSGYSIDERTDSLLENGCNGFIQKPFNLKSLSQQIKSALNN